MPSSFPTTPALVLLLLSLAGCNAPPQRIFVPVLDASGRTEAELETHVYKPAGSGPFPVAVINHGSSAGQPKATQAWEREAAYLVDKGYAVLAPMRKGRGRSTGQSLESEDRNCDPESWTPGVQDALRDLDATLQWAAAQPWARPHAVLMAGVSRGGFLAVAYAAQGRYRQDVHAVVNFVGGWVAQAEDQCPQDFNLLSFQRLGAQARTPMLWLYGAGDRYYGDDAVRAYAQAFNRAGGQAEFHLVGGIPDNGHALVEHPGRWTRLVDAFLRAHPAPSTPPAP